MAEEPGNELTLTTILQGLTAQERVWTKHIAKEHGEKYVIGHWSFYERQLEYIRSLTDGHVEMPSLTSDEIIQITKESALGLAPSLTSQAAINYREVMDEEKLILMEKGLTMAIPAAWPLLD